VTDKITVKQLRLFRQCSGSSETEFASANQQQFESVFCVCEFAANLHLGFITSYLDRKTVPRQATFSTLLLVCSVLHGDGFASFCGWHEDLVRDVIEQGRRISELE
jgi:hypothetical protein